MRGEAQTSLRDAICTIAIPVHNQRPFIARSVNSALDQDGIKADIIVVDNCSDDGTWEYLQKLTASNVSVYRNETNRGLFGNFNRCLELASTPYLRFLSGDDALVPGCLRGEIGIMERYPEIAMLSSQGRFVTPSLRSGGHFANDFPAGIYRGAALPSAWFEYYARYRRNPLNYPSGILFRRASINGVRFEEGWRTAGDIDFYFKVLRKGDLAILDSVGCEVTRHARQAHISPNLNGKALEEQLLLLERYIDTPARDALMKYLAGTCLALALLRLIRPRTWFSAGIHWRLARRLATLPAAFIGLAALIAFRAARAVVGKAAPFVARPDRPIR